MKKYLVEVEGYIDEIYFGESLKDAVKNAREEISHNHLKYGETLNISKCFKSPFDEKWYSEKTLFTYIQGKSERLERYDALDLLEDGYEKENIYQLVRRFARKCEEHFKTDFSEEKDAWMEDIIKAEMNSVEAENGLNRCELEVVHKNKLFTLEFYTREVEIDDEIDIQYWTRGE